MSKVTLDFNDLAAGTVVDDEYASRGIRISTKEDKYATPPEGSAMIFDSSHPTGGDSDLKTDNLGKVLIISEDGDSSDPDDEAEGGEIYFDFDDPITFHSITLLDVEEGAYVTLYDAEGDKITYDKYETDNNGQTIADFGAVEGVSRVEVKLKGSGAVDNLVYSGGSGGEGDGIVEGTDGDDVIDVAYTGDPEGDMIDNDDAILPGEEGDDDVVLAGAGDDEIIAGEGDDEVFAGSGDDTVEGNAGDDLIVGGSGDDLIMGGNGDDVLFGDGENGGIGRTNYFPEWQQDISNVVIYFDRDGDGEIDYSVKIDGFPDSGDDSFISNDLDDYFGQVLDYVYEQNPELEGKAVTSGVSIKGGKQETEFYAVNGNENGEAADPGPVMNTGPGNDMELDYCDFYDSYDPHANGGGGSDDGGTDDSFNDVIIGGAGGDFIDGGQGNDILIGDGPGVGEGGGEPTSTQEAFKWSELNDYKGNLIEDDDKIVSQSQDTGENTVTLTLEKASENTFADNAQKVHSIDTGELGGANPYSSLSSELDDDDDEQTYTLDFEKQVENISFRVNDIDYDSTVVIKAYDAQGNEIPVTMSAGDGVALHDNDGVDGYETAVSKGGGAADTSPTYSALVSVPGPASKLVITHLQHGDSDSGVNVTDIYFDTITGGEEPGEPGDDIIVGGLGDDYIEGNGGNDKLLGGEGDDTILGGDGDDNIFGGDGDDTIDGGDGNDTLAGGSGNDTISGGEGDDTIRGHDGNDTLDGGAGNDTIYGGADDDVISGGDGDDHIDGMSGDDVILGGAGDDVIEGGGGNDEIRGGDGNDTISGYNNEDLIYGDAGDDEITAGGSNDEVYGGDGSDTVDGGDGDDYINTAGNIDRYGVSGTPDRGYPGIWAPDADPYDDRDTVYGGKGDDTIITGDDHDYIEGGEGNDTINAGFDDDTIFGGDGDDVIIGGEGSDTIDGGAGDDTIYGGLDPAFPDAINIPDDEGDARPDNAKDEIRGGEGNDTIYGQDDDDIIYGDEGDDYIDGGVDDDLIFGGTGNDTIIGGEGVDTLFGDDDRDTFIGGNDGDKVDGGAGGDDFDTLDLTGTGVDFVEYTSADREDGIVHFEDGGKLEFKEIENVIPCFTPGTLIATPRGEVAVEDLRAGDTVITRDNGIQHIRWIGRTDVDTVELMKRPQLRPVRIARGALGGDLPERDMLVSPQHRVLVANDRTALYFEEREVLVAARHLVDGKGISEAQDVASVSYIHFMFDQHEVVLSDGAWTESFQPGDYTLDGLGAEQREEILALFPELAEAAGRKGYSAARKTLKRHEALLLTE